MSNEQKIADYYGLDKQLRQLQEECGELIVAVNKYFRKKDWYSVEPPAVLLKEQRKELINELADVIVMINQIVYLMDAHREMNDVMSFKIYRQLKRIEEELLIHDEAFD